MSLIILYGSSAENRDSLNPILFLNFRTLWQQINIHLMYTYIYIYILTCGTLVLNLIYQTPTHPCNTCILGMYLIKVNTPIFCRIERRLNTYFLFCKRKLFSAPCKSTKVFCNLHLLCVLLATTLVKNPISAKKGFL